MPFHNFKKQYLDIQNITGAENLLRVINTLQSNIESSISSIVAKFQLDSIILTNITLVPGKINIVNHTLNKKLTGWQIIRKRDQANIWDNQDDNAAQTLTLYLNTDVECVVDIMVF